MAMFDPMLFAPFRKQFPQFTSAQCPCVFMYSLGFSLVNIAKTLGLNVKTVEYHIENASKVIGIENARDLRAVILIHLSLQVMALFMD